VVSAESKGARGLPDPEFWRGRRVFVTGHTGFIGGWTCAWLHALQSEVTGAALEPPSRPSFYELTQLGSRIRSIIADIRSSAELARAFAQARPQIVFHLAAQPIVREAYDRPLDTFEVNLMGTVQVLEQARLRRPAAVVAITSDKVYATSGDQRSHTENDRLGPCDPYGSSKACCELAIEAYARSFLEPAGIGAASVRAGNVIGGGDWGADRLFPDAVRAFSAGETLTIRNPEAVRPWQHVLDAVNGLLLVAEKAVQKPVAPAAWNVGPSRRSPVNVGSLAEMIASAWHDGARTKIDSRSDFPETHYLALDSSRARRELLLQSPWAVDRTIAETVTWYKKALSGTDAWKLTQAQIAGYGIDRSRIQSELDFK
jgi:CDP-glucose 4,6-dehydratase